MGCSLCKYAICYNCFLNIEKNLTNKFILSHQNKSIDFDNILINISNDFFFIICHNFKINKYLFFRGNKNTFNKNIPSFQINEEEKKYFNY